MTAKGTNIYINFCELKCVGMDKSGTLLKQKVKVFFFVREWEG
jgi:hypothetical protein